MISPGGEMSAAVEFHSAHAALADTNAFAAYLAHLSRYSVGLQSRHSAGNSRAYPHGSTRLAGAWPKFAGRPLSNHAQVRRDRK
jgi:hypothetical protein